ncbi:MAG: hypothetical protein GY859_34770 [Desulfobacterales bacterium]|nr:hypothetical protein [Desulfobacterales bacterium]
MSLNCPILSEENKERVHGQSLRILSDVGVQFLSDKALAILSENGAKVDFDEKIARIPGEMVDEALRTAPKSFVLGARNSEFDFRVPSAYTGCTLDGAATFARDFETGERRRATLKDLQDSLRVFEEMRLGVVAWPPIMVDDIPLNSRRIRTIVESFKYTSKHVQDELHHPREVPYLIETLAAIAGGEDAVREKKLFSVCYCTVPPLTHDKHMCEAYLELVDFHIPILSFPMPAAGSTGPASLYSNLAVANAEGLSTLVLFQMAKPGTPIIFGDASGTTNFASGAFLEGAAETALQTGAMGEMAHYYNLPDTQAGCLTDSKAPDSQAALEKMLTTFPLVLNGADIINGIGELEASQLLVLEQIVVDHEIMCMCERIWKGVDFSEKKDCLADVARVKPGGHFLMEKNTLDLCMSDEFYQPRLADRNSYEDWIKLGKPDFYSKAKEKVREILAAPLKNPLPDDTIGKLETILEKAEGKP